MCATQIIKSDCIADGQYIYIFIFQYFIQAQFSLVSVEQADELLINRAGYFFKNSKWNFEDRMRNKYQFKLNKTFCWGSNRIPK